MSTELVLLAALMGAATFPFRAIPLLAPGFERLPAQVRLYLRLVGPSVLAALAAVNTFVGRNDAGGPAFHVGIEWVAVGLCVAVVGARRSLLVGLVLAAALVALARSLGIAPPP
ncbi:MAG TPA: AzlD domain-containing protein [Candidatus Binatia bacterium]|nr:AzlD domain-containing protein [Candidatus Binatia bacterium]